MVLKEIAERLGELFNICVVAGEALADAIDKGVDKLFDNLK